MRINGTHISEYGATLLDRNISSNRVSYNATWDYMMDRPAFYGNALEFKYVLLYLKVEAETEEQFLKVMGTMCEALRKGGVVRFDDIDLNYTMYMKQKPEYTKLNETVYRLDFVLDSDYGLSDAKMVSGGNKVTVTNNGAYPTPAMLVLSVPSMRSEIVITGFERDLVLTNTPSNAVIVIDSIQGTIIINGENGIENLKSFHLPKLPVGRSEIRANCSCNMQVQYYERY